MDENTVIMEEYYDQAEDSTMSDMFAAEQWNYILMEMGYSEQERVTNTVLEWI